MITAIQYLLGVHISALFDDEATALELRVEGKEEFGGKLKFRQLCQEKILTSLKEEEGEKEMNNNK